MPTRCILAFVALAIGVAIRPFDTEVIMLQHRPAALTYALLALSATACGTPEKPAESAAEALPTEAEIRAVLTTLNDEWAAAVRARDFEAQAAFIAEDAVRLQPDIPALVGREAIRQWLQSQVRDYDVEGSDSVVDVRVLGKDWAMARMTSVYNFTPKSGGTSVERKEKWIAVIQRQPDGAWKWHWHAGNSDSPGR